MNFARRASGANENSDNTDDNQYEKRPLTHDAGKNTKQSAKDEESDVPTDVVFVLNVFFGVPLDV